MTVTAMPAAKKRTKPMKDHLRKSVSGKEAALVGCEKIKTMQI
jgi:hypothetical protein